MFTIFDQELRKFRQATIFLDSFLSQIPEFNNIQRAKTGTSAHDIVIAGLSFRRAFEEAYQYWMIPKDISVVGSPIDWELAPDPLKYLEASIKALLFPIRSFQDNIYGIFLYLDGLLVGRDTTMKKCLENSDNPISHLIDQKLAEYRKWFFEMRDIRNRIKSGNSFSFGFKNERFGIILNNFDGAHSALEAPLDQIVSIDTFVEVFKQSTEISELAFNYGKDHNLIK